VAAPVMSMLRPDRPDCPSCIVEPAQTCNPPCC
jgi:hypothetical protein